MQSSAQQKLERYSSTDVIKHRKKLLPELTEQKHKPPQIFEKHSAPNIKVRLSET